MLDRDLPADHHDRVRSSARQLCVEYAAAVDQRHRRGASAPKLADRFGQERRTGLSEGLVLGLIGVGAPVGLADCSLTLVIEEAFQTLANCGSSAVEATGLDSGVNRSKGLLWDAHCYLRRHA